MEDSETRRFTPEEIAAAKRAIAATPRRFAWSMRPMVANEVARILAELTAVDAEPRGEVSPPNARSDFNEWCASVAYWHVDQNATLPEQLERMAALCISEAIRIRTAALAGT